MKLLIINDFSTDDTFEKAKELFGSNKNFKIFMIMKKKVWRSNKFRY